MIDTLLSVLGILAIGACLIAVWVFAGAAKRYITGEDMREEMQAMESDLSPYRHWVDRAPSDRRQARPPIQFPITVNGAVIREDRRSYQDRRRAA